MGARGSSSGRTPPPAPTPPLTPPKPKPPVSNPKPLAGLILDTMSDKQLDSFVMNAKKLQLSREFHDDVTQRMVIAGNWNDKPEILPPDQVEALAKKQGAVVLYRTNCDCGNTKAAQFSDQFRHGDAFSTGGGGGQVHGGGLYFSSSLRGSKRYGYGKADTIGAVLNKNAKVIDKSALRGAAGVAWVNAHPKAAKRMGLSVITMSGGRQRVESRKLRNSKGDRECGSHLWLWQWVITS